MQKCWANCCFLNDGKGGDVCHLVVLIMLDTKKTPGVLLWNGARKKTLLCGIDHLIHEIEKKRILLKKPLHPIDPGFDLGNMVVVKVIVISSLNFWWQFFCYFVKLFFEIFLEINMFFQVMVCFSAQNSPKKNMCAHTPCAEAVSKIQTQHHQSLSPHIHWCL